jgi:hypothetical protein
MDSNLQAEELQSDGKSRLLIIINEHAIYACRSASDDEALELSCSCNDRALTAHKV